ncbi:translation initiation factor IF-2-like [Mustela erminea]|uniref:translation initiation factor IF-2-like n=1 Tax=Mustela erminea TaxID=36723 RepID=UPI00138690F9|nr:translation initiation factor IF-2-like [Mustela erminea]
MANRNNYEKWPAQPVSTPFLLSDGRRTIRDANPDPDASVPPAVRGATARSPGSADGAAGHDDPGAAPVPAPRSAFPAPPSRRSPRPDASRDRSAGRSPEGTARQPPLARGPRGARPEASNGKRPPRAHARPRPGPRAAPAAAAQTFGTTRLPGGRGTPGAASVRPGARTSPAAGGRPGAPGVGTRSPRPGREAPLPAQHRLSGPSRTRAPVPAGLGPAAPSALSIPRTAAASAGRTNTPRPSRDCVGSRTARPGRGARPQRDDAGPERRPTRTGAGKRAPPAPRTEPRRAQRPSLKTERGGLPAASPLVPGAVGVGSASLGAAGREPCEPREPCDPRLSPARRPGTSACGGGGNRSRHFRRRGGPLDARASFRQSGARRSATGLGRAGGRGTQTRFPSAPAGPSGGRAHARAPAARARACACAAQPLGRPPCRRASRSSRGPRARLPPSFPSVDAAAAHRCNKCTNTGC